MSSIDRHRIEVAAAIHERRTKQPGKHGGALGGPRALQLLSLLLGLQLGSPFGRLDPSYLWLAAKLGWSVGTVARKLASLEGAGLLAWFRRMKPVEDDEAAWRWAQTSNAYRILIPAWIAAALPAGMTPPAAGSEDFEHARAVQAETIAAHVRTLGPSDRVEFTRQADEMGPLEAAIARFAGAFERATRPQPDSEIRAQSPSALSAPGGCGAGLSAGNIVAWRTPPDGGEAIGEESRVAGRGQPPPGSHSTG